MEEETELQELLRIVHELQSQIDRMATEMEATKGLIARIQEQVGPTLESLMKSSMFRMVFGK